MAALPTEQRSRAEMYVCQCRLVTDRAVGACVAEGCRDLADLARRCGAGSRCGGCVPALAEIFDELGLVGAGATD
ncbi:MAG: (2Fe-2S)-binding protein [Acidimicrobiia bacterium]